MTRARPRLVILLAVLLAAPAAGEPAEVAGPALARLEVAAAAYPDDADLAWAVAIELDRSGRTADAVTRLEGFVARWPDRRPEASLLLGRWQSELGRPAEALPHLQRAVEEDPASGSAHLLLALVLRQLGRAEEAERHFEVAAAREPSLRSEALLLQALTRLELGDEEGGNRLLRETVTLDPDTEPARTARLVLEGTARGRSALPRRAYRVDTYSGFEHDTNVVLDSGIGLPGLPDERRDGAFLWGTALTVYPLRGERVGLTIGARYDQSAHLDLDSYDTQSFTGFASARWRSGRRLTWRFDGLIGYASLDGDPYVLSGMLRPNLIVTLGERSGVLRAFGEFEPFEYHEEPLFSSLERDGWGLGGGLEHYLSIPRWRGAWGSWRVDFRRYETEAEPDLLDFAGDYDHDRWRAVLSAHLPLLWGFDADAAFSLARESYRNDNLIDFLTEVQLGDFSGPSKRRDTVFETRLALVRPLTRFVDGEIRWRYADRHSNADVYAYDRHVVGFYLRVHL